MTQNGENKTALPRGFETGGATQEVSYAKKDAAPQKTNTVDLRGRPGGGRGGPGARMAALRAEGTMGMSTLEFANSGRRGSTPPARRSSAASAVRK